jgi:hypothetical protein
MHHGFGKVKIMKPEFSLFRRNGEEQRVPAN